MNAAENVFYEDPEPYYNTQYRILKGRDLTRRVIKKFARMPRLAWLNL